MSAKTKRPESLIEAIVYFSDLDVATEFVAKLRWPDGPFCPSCGCTEYSYLMTRRVWKCKACKRQYSVKVGTIFEDSPLPLTTWLPAVWLVANSKNGISSHELARALKVTQKSAWFMLHRIRLAMRTESIMLSGEVEIDETYLGGESGNMHASSATVERQTTSNKTTVLGTVGLGGRVRAEVVPHARRRSIEPPIRGTVVPGSTVYTDGLGRRLTYAALIAAD
ncbi:MAG: IS1595 family transposase [Solirubrobacteraceae bacterium]